MLRDKEKPINASTERPCTPNMSHAALSTAISSVVRAASPSTPPGAVTSTASRPRSDKSSPTTRKPSRDENKHISSVPPSSQTPPSSSQQHRKQAVNTESPVMRTVTPAYSTMSSTPISLSRGSDLDVHLTSLNSYAVPTIQEIREATEQDLRDMLHTCIAENTRLEAVVNQERMSSTYYRLQHQLLGIETFGDRSRMDVEHEMTKREVEVLRMAELTRESQRLNSSANLAIVHYTADLRAHCEAVDSENRLLSRRLEKAKRLIMDKDDELENVLEDNRNYLKRIKENREHFNRLKSEGGIYSTSAQESPSYPVTPQQHFRSTPRRMPRSASHYHPRAQLETGQDAFSALLEADRVLQGGRTETPPQTTFQAPNPSFVRQYSRNVDATSSLPTTPIRGGLSSEYSHLLPAVQLFPQSDPRYKTSYSGTTPRSRKSRDSTISISDAEDIVHYNQTATRQANIQACAPRADHIDVEVPYPVSNLITSPANPSSHGQILQSPVVLQDKVERRPLPNERGGVLQQAKIRAAVTKPNLIIEKRKRLENDEEQFATKVRAGEGIGLGIGNWQ